MASEKLLKRRKKGRLLCAEEVRSAKQGNHLKLFVFVGIVRDDLKQVKSDVRNISEKLKSLRSSETKDKGQFQETLCGYRFSFFVEGRAETTITEAKSLNIIRIGSVSTNIRTA